MQPFGHASTCRSRRPDPSNRRTGLAIAVACTSLLATAHAYALPLQWWVRGGPELNTQTTYELGLDTTTYLTTGNPDDTLLIPSGTDVQLKSQSRTTSYATSGGLTLGDWVGLHDSLAGDLEGTFASYSRQAVSSLLWTHRMDDAWHTDVQGEVRWSKSLPTSSDSALAFSTSTSVQGTWLARLTGMTSNSTLRLEANYVRLNVQPVSSYQYNLGRITFQGNGSTRIGGVNAGLDVGYQGRNVPDSTVLDYRTGHVGLSADGLFWGESDWSTSVRTDRWAYDLPNAEGDAWDYSASLTGSIYPNFGDGPGYRLSLTGDVRHVDLPTTTYRRSTLLDIDLAPQFSSGLSSLSGASWTLAPGVRIERAIYFDGTNHEKNWQAGPAVDASYYASDLSAHLSGALGFTLYNDGPSVSDGGATSYRFWELSAGADWMMLPGLTLSGNIDWRNESHSDALDNYDGLFGGLYLEYRFGK